MLTYIFRTLEQRFDGRPTLLVLDEAWLFLDQGAFAAKIREWLKTLRKFNVAVVFATQSLADIARSSIAPALIESCPTRVFLPNPDAHTPQIAEPLRGLRAERPAAADRRRGHAEARILLPVLGRQPAVRAGAGADRAGRRRRLVAG